jgi:hypothetical protein
MYIHMYIFKCMYICTSTGTFVKMSFYEVIEKAFFAAVDWKPTFFCFFQHRPKDRRTKLHH